MMKLASALAMSAMVLSPADVAAQGGGASTAHAFTFEAIDGKPMPFSQFRGKVVLVVNTASFCGFTKQYTGLESLYQRYKDRGLIVLGVPSNDFGAQEPGTNAEIAQFCQGAFNVTFPLTEKVQVKGRDAHAFYVWAAEALGAAAAPRWNFHKYLVGGNGKLIASFASSVEPEAAQIIKAIETALEGSRQAGG